MNTYQIKWLSPIGIISVEGTKEVITTIQFQDGVSPISPKEEAPLLLKEAIQQIKAYFSGGKNQFSLSLKYEGTPFQKKVWESIDQIPIGETASYQQLAEKLGDKKAVRAVGSASSLNKFLIVIPCHRIVGSDGSLTGYAGGVWRKKWLLEHEKKIAGRPHQLSIF